MTFNLQKSRLAEISLVHLQKRFRSIAMLDAILMPEWELRYFSYDSRWASDEEMASMRDGQGGEYFFLFNSSGVIGKIFEPESGLLPHTHELFGVKEQFPSFWTEPAFSVEAATNVLWRSVQSTEWMVLPNTSTSIPLLGFIGDNGDYYHSWAEGYYETSIDSSLIKSVFSGSQITLELVRALNPDANMGAVQSEAFAIGLVR